MKPTVSRQQHPAPVADVPLPGAGVERREQLVLDVARRPRSARSSACSCRRWCSRRARRCAPPARLLTSRSLRACTSASFGFRSRMRSPTSRRSSSSCVSPGPRRPMPPPFCRRQVGPHPLRAAAARIRAAPARPAAGPRRSGAGGEDVEDQLAAVDHLDADAPSRGCGPGPGDRSLSKMTTSASVASTSSCSSCDLARADVGGEVDVLPLLREFADHVRPGGGRRARGSRRTGRRSARAGPAGPRSPGPPSRWQPRTRRAGLECFTDVSLPSIACWCG